MTECREHRPFYQNQYLGLHVPQASLNCIGNYMFGHCLPQPSYQPCPMPPHNQYYVLSSAQVHTPSFAFVPTVQVHNPPVVLPAMTPSTYYVPQEANPQFNRVSFQPFPFIQKPYDPCAFQRQKQTVVDCNTPSSPPESGKLPNPFKRVKQPQRFLPFIGHLRCGYHTANLESVADLLEITSANEGYDFRWMRMRRIPTETRQQIVAKADEVINNWLNFQQKDWPVFDAYFEKRAKRNLLRTNKHLLEIRKYIPKIIKFLKAIKKRCMSFSSGILITLFAGGVVYCEAVLRSVYSIIQITPDYARMLVDQTPTPVVQSEASRQP